MLELCRVSFSPFLIYGPSLFFSGLRIPYSYLQLSLALFSTHLEQNKK